LRRESIQFTLTPDHLKQGIYIIGRKQGAFFLEPKTKTNIQEDLSQFESYLIRREKIEKFRGELNTLEIYIKNPNTFSQMSAEFIDTMNEFFQKKKEYAAFKSLSYNERKHIFRLSFCMYKYNNSLEDFMCYGSIN
jgi:hypothetical protein